MESYNCVVVCRRKRAGVDEVLVQWECSWVDADVVPLGEVMRVLMRRTIGSKHEMLVQWACTWEPVGQVDVGAVEDYVGDVFGLEVDAVADVKQSVVGRVARIKRRNRGW